MSTLTPYTVNKLQLKYIKSGVVEDKWLGLYAYYWRFAVCVIVISSLLPESFVVANPALTNLSNSVSTYCQKLLSIDLSEGLIGSVRSPQSYMLFRSVLVLCIIFIFVINFLIRPLNFKRKVNYMWALNSDKSPLVNFFYVIFILFFLFFFFKFLVIDTPAKMRPFEFRGGGLHSGVERAFAGFGFLFFWQIFCWGYIEIIAGALFGKRFD